MVSQINPIASNKDISFEYPVQNELHQTTINTSTVLGYSFIIGLVIVNELGIIDSPAKLFLALGLMASLGYAYLKLN